MDTASIVTWSLLIIIIIMLGYSIKRSPRAKIHSKHRSTLVDTSVLMDGRIISIARSGFIGDTLVIPRSVVGELQFLADNADADKRARARMGLDAISELQSIPAVTVEILQDGSRATDGVDERLLELAKANGASICTIDFNLNKVAVVEGIRVLNINELAQGLRLAHLPGEQILIELVQKGQDNHQAVGYLNDGTMVVVENASSLLGNTVEIEVIRSLQTAAGKMMFARIAKTKEKNSVQKTPQKTVQSTKPTKEIVKKSAQSSRNNRKPSSRDDQKTVARQKKNPTSRDREAMFMDLIDQQ